MGRRLREALRYLEYVAVAMNFLRHADLGDDPALGLEDACTRLAAAEPMSHEGWVLLARVVRHLSVTFEEQQDPRLPLARQLHSDVMRYVDRTAASGRQKGNS